MKRPTPNLQVGLIAGVALLALSACGKKTDTAAPSAGEGGAAAPANATASSPSPISPPHRKAGLWVVSVTSGERMKQTIRQCLDETTEAKMKWWGSNASSKSSDCQQESVTPHLGGGWDFHSVCNMGESGTVTADGAARGDFSSHYTVEVNSVTSGSPMPEANGTHKTSMAGDWQGPCPADMKPGDMEVNGFKINLTSGADGKPGITLPNGKTISPAEAAAFRQQAKAMAAAMKDQQK